MENKKQNVSYIFGKTLTEHLETKDVNERYLDLRFERFAEEFLQKEDVEFQHIEYMMDAIYDYLGSCMEAQELDHCLLNLKQSIYWLGEYSGGDYE